LASGVTPDEGVVTVSGSKGESREARKPEPAKAGRPASQPKLPITSEGKA